MKNTQFPKDLSSTTSKNTEADSVNIDNEEFPKSSNLMKIQVHKCCEEGQIFSHKHKSCVDGPDIPFTVPVFTQDGFGMFLETNFSRKQVRLEFLFIL